MVSKRVIFGAFLFLVSSNFLYSGGVFNKTIIPFALVGYEISYSQLGPTIPIFVKNKNETSTTLTLLRKVRHNSENYFVAL